MHIFIFSVAVERYLMEQVGELHQKMDYVISLLQKDHPGAATEAPTILPMLPLQTVEDLQAFDTRLQNDVSFRTEVVILIHDSQMQTTKMLSPDMQQVLKLRCWVYFILQISKLSLAGGRTVKETVWRVCAKVIHQNLATQLNWCGRGEKTGLQSTPTHHALLSKSALNQ